MLVVLSEINCLKSLNEKGVYPDEFYTSVAQFKNNTVFLKDATVLIIFGGNCRFNKKHTLELVKNLMKRANNDKDVGIQHVYVISDMTIAGLNSYYKYEGSIDTVSIMRGWNEVKKGINIWVKLTGEPKEAKCFLSDFDKGEVSDFIHRYNFRKNSEDDYINLIKVPNLRELLAQ